MSIRYLRIAVVLLAFSGSAPVSAAPVPMLNLKELTEGSDLIVVGRVHDVVAVGSQPITLKGQIVESRTMRGGVTVSSILKGDGADQELALEYQIPEEPVGYVGVPSPSFRLLFLKWSGKAWTLANPYYPSFPVTQNKPIEKPEALDRVLEYLIQSMNSPMTPVDDRAYLTWVVGSVQNDTTTAALFVASADSNPTVKVAAVSELLKRNDIRRLPVASEVFARRIVVPDFLIENVASAIEIGVSDPKALSELRKIAKSADVRARRAAVFAIRRIGNHQSIPLLVSALDDSDERVRYFAVIGLGEITNQPGWRPLMDAYRENEERYLMYWRKWAVENGFSHSVQNLRTPS